MYCNIFNSMDKVMVGQRPSHRLKKSIALKNERINFYLLIDSLDKDLTAQINIEGIDDVAVRICSVGKVNVALPISEKHDDYILSDKAGEYYDILYPVDTKSVKLIKNAKNLFFISLMGDKTPFLAGLKTPTVKIRVNNKAFVKRFKLEIIDTFLCENPLMVSNWFHYDCLAEYHNADVFSKPFYSLLDKYLENYVEHGNNMILTPLFTPPLDTEINQERLTCQLVEVSLDNRNYSFDFSKLNEFIDFVFKKGIKFIEFSHLFSQWGAEFCPKVIVNENGVNINKFGWNVKSDDKEYLDFLAKFLTELNKFIKNKGITERCFFHLSDEPDVIHIEKYKMLYNYVKQIIPDYKIIDALSNVEYYKQGIIDLPFVCIDHSQTFSNEKLEHAVYNCCLPSDRYYSNRFIVYSSLRTRILGYMMYKNNAKGYLHWGYNFYHSLRSHEIINPFETTDGKLSFPAGDPFIVYPSDSGCLDSLRHEACLEGLQDYRALHTLENLTNREYVEKILSKKIKGYNVYPHDIKFYQKERDKIYFDIKRYEEIKLY